MIAALFVETNGVYFGLPNVDPWDRRRDARLYYGPWPVVAHPPCEERLRAIKTGCVQRLSKRQSLATPPAFRDALIDIAERSSGAFIQKNA